MRYVEFLKAGRVRDDDRVFLTTHGRTMADRARTQHTIYHRNDWSTIWRIPVPFYRQHFTYERQSGIYRTDLRYRDLVEFRTEIKHTA